MKKKLLSVLLSAAMVAAMLTGCGASGSAASEDTDTAEAASETEAADSTEAETADTAAAEETADAAEAESSASGDVTI